MEHWPGFFGWEGGCLRWIKNGQECEKYWKSLGKSWEQIPNIFLPLCLSPYKILSKRRNTADDQPQPMKILWNEKNYFPNGNSCVMPLLLNIVLPQFISLNFMELSYLWKSWFTFSVHHSRANILEWLLCGQEGRKCIFLLQAECGDGSFRSNQQITGAQ